MKDITSASLLTSIPYFPQSGKITSHRSSDKRPTHFTTRSALCNQLRWALWVSTVNQAKKRINGPMPNGVVTRSLCHFGIKNGSAFCIIIPISFVTWSMHIGTPKFHCSPKTEIGLSQDSVLGSWAKFWGRRQDIWDIKPLCHLADEWGPTLSGEVTHLRLGGWKHCNAKGGGTRVLEPC